MIAAALTALTLLAAAAAPSSMTAEQVSELRRVRQVSMAPSGRLVAYTLSVPRDPYADEDGAAHSELHVAGPRPGASRAFITGEVSIGDLGWTSDGQDITFVTKRGKHEKDALWAIAVDGGEARMLVAADESVQGYALSPDGKQVAWLAKEKKAEADTKRGDKGFTAEVFEEVDQLVRVFVASLESEGGARREAVETKEARMLELPGSAGELRWSPAGDRLALTLAPSGRIDDRYMRQRVRIVDVATGQILAKVENAGKIRDLRWSPDGARLAYLSAADYNDPNAGQLVVVSKDGGEQVNVLASFEGDCESAEWLDDDNLLFTASVGTEQLVGRVRHDGDKRKVLVAAGEAVYGSLSVAGDGKRAALVTHTAAHPGELAVWSKGDKRAARWTRSNPWLEGMALAKQETFEYEARDGLKLQGILVHPLTRKSGQRVPLIMHVHGGPESHVSNGWVTGYSWPGQVAAAKGYAVFYPNYRGSTGRGVAFSKLGQADYAGGEFNDLVDAVGALDAKGLIDPKKVGVTGSSYGGFATAWCATALSEHFAAGVMFVGISDQLSKFGTTDIPEEMHAVHSRRWPWEHWDWFRERSPIYHSEKGRTPLLIMHGTDDPRVPVSQGKELYRYLKTLGKVPVRLVLYPGEGHGNRKAAARYDYNLRLLRWFDHYLMGPGGAPPPVELDLDADKLGLEDEGKQADEP